MFDSLDFVNNFVDSNDARTVLFSVLLTMTVLLVVSEGFITVFLVHKGVNHVVSPGQLDLTTNEMNFANVFEHVLVFQAIRIE